MQMHKSYRTYNVPSQHVSVGTSHCHGSYDVTSTQISCLQGFWYLAMFSKTMDYLESRLRTTWGPAMASILSATPSLTTLVLQSGCSAMAIDAQPAAQCQETHFQATL